jgi:hypothetical protein
MTPKIKQILGVLLIGMSLAALVGGTIITIILVSGLRTFLLLALGVCLFFGAFILGLKMLDQAGDNMKGWRDL